MRSLAVEDRIDGCMRLADFWAGRHDKRREFEWKLTLGIWAVLVAGISYHDKLPKVNFLVWLIACIALFFVYVFLWLLPLWHRNQIDLHQAFEAANLALVTINDPNSSGHSQLTVGRAPTRRESFGELKVFIKNWSVDFQICTTLVLAVCFLFSVFHS